MWLIFVLEVSEKHLLLTTRVYHEKYSDRRQREVKNTRRRNNTESVLIKVSILFEIVQKTWSQELWQAAYILSNNSIEKDQRCINTFARNCHKKDTEY